MEYVIQNPGLEHITEMILFNLNFEGLKKCQNLNKSIKKTLEDPMFWLRKWRTQRGLSKKNYNDWEWDITPDKAIELTKNTIVDANDRLFFLFYYSNPLANLNFFSLRGPSIT